MKLSAYLELTKTTDEEFGRRIQRDRSTVSRLRRGLIRPDWKTVERIHVETDGAVTVNDFVSAPTTEAAQ